MKKSSDNNQVAMKRPGRTLKEIIEASNEGVPAPSEEARKANRSKRKKVDSQSSSEILQSASLGGSEKEENKLKPRAPQISYINGKLQVLKESLDVYLSGDEEVRNKESSRGRRRKEKSEKWLPEETERFYKALQIFGTDFSIIVRLLPGRSRKQIKNKFNREERENPEKIDSILKQAGTCTLEEFEKCYGKLDSNPVSTLRQESDASVINDEVVTKKRQEKVNSSSESGLCLMYALKMEFLLTIFCIFEAVSYTHLTLPTICSV
eukprot:TRINITY_DN4611_c0_g1_i1.p1 TRINITY_DN4611_c0_g1~~TRINITY_DN4611_c0_g1_i1.p1  ORF type:complete len:265 (+),score=59.04 TRINITY_DN4611_c0_g1_i1:229-1023(+)